ncbi:amino acid adenylation domain-containing protein [Laceyella putida]|uniref:Amino acid adenylation domain-containing protein n=1 Tax=Laceyella putida TaxID=110101 RepID=A0ABW2RPZ8_9BACL
MSYNELVHPWRKGRAYYREYLRGYNEGIQIIPELKSGNLQVRATMRPEEVTFYLDSHLTNEIIALADKMNVTVSTLLSLMWGVLLQKYNNTNDVVFASISPGSHDGDEELAVQLRRVQCASGETIYDLVAKNMGHPEMTAIPLSQLEELTGIAPSSLQHLFCVMETGREDSEDTEHKAESEYDRWLAGWKDSHLVLHVLVTLGGQLTMRFKFDETRFHPDWIERVGHHFARVVQSFVYCPELVLHELELMADAEKEKLLYGFNDTKAAYPGDQTIHALFEQQVQRTPDQVAVVFKDEELTYRQLDERANQLAHALRRRGVGREQIVGILVRPSLEMIIGVLGVLKAGAAYLPIDPQYPLERIDYMLQDSRAAMLLTQTGLTVPVEWRERKLYLDRIAWEEGGIAVEGVESTPNHLAYVIYTSGSTGKPKGVMVEHRALVNLASWHVRRFEVTAQDRAMKYAGFGFDASVWEVFPYLIAGATLVVIPEEIRLDVEALNRYMEEEGVTICFLPTPVAEQFMRLENRSLTRLLTGGDRLQQVRPQTYRLFNNYGPTENAVVATCFEVKPGEPILIGKPIANNQAYVVSEEGSLQPIGVPGELCLAGDSLARGYLHQKELTLDRFVPNPFVPGERMYKTGDLVRWLPDGNLEFLGRIDDQVKIRGYRVELGEIGSVLLRHPSIEDAVVITRTDHSGQPVLCAYVVAGERVNEKELRAHLARDLPEYMIPTHFVLLDRLPLTPNGKVDKKVLPEPVAEKARPDRFLAPVHPVEVKLAQLWQEVLQVDHVGLHDHFFALGGHSLKLMMLATRIRAEFGVEVDFVRLFHHPTLSEMASLVQAADSTTTGSLQPVAEQAYYPVTSVQRRLYAVEQLENIGVTYHNPVVLELAGELDGQRLRQSLQAVVDRHEALRTSFHLVDGELMQKVESEAALPWEQFEVKNEAEARERIQQLIRPFDLSRAPLIRAGLLQLETERHVLVLDIHHIVSDAVSIESILYHELGCLYRGETLPAPAWQYKEVAVWHEAWKQTVDCQKQGEYWSKQFADEWPVLDMPTDYPRPNIQQFSGGKVRFSLDVELAERLKRISEQEEATLFMVLLATYKLMLAKLSGQDDLVVGFPIAGRSQAEAEQIFGMFVNTLPLRTQPISERSFSQYLAEVKDKVLSAYSHGDYPLEEIVEKRGIARDRSRNPLFDTVFVLQNVEAASLDLPGIAVKAYSNWEWKQSMFDMTWEAEEQETIHFAVEYNTALFSRATIERLIGYYSHLLRQVVADPERSLGEFDIVPEAEKERLLTTFNATEAEYPRDKTLHQCFAEQVKQTPDLPAVVYRTETLTYRELDARANRLARRLRDRGAEREQIIGIMVRPSLEMVVSVLGVLKSGAAYLPIDVDYPTERIMYMLEDSQARLLLAERGVEVPAEWLDRVLWLDELDWMAGDGSEVEVDSQPNDLAYVIYTSGSTGKPKGVMVEHRSVLNLAAWHIREFAVTAEDRATKYAGFGFDASVWEIYPYLLTGATLYVIPEELRLDVGGLNRYMEEQGITISFLPTQLAEQFMQLENKSLKTLLVGGDRLQQLQPQTYRVVNNYGPTENTVVTTSGELSPEMEVLPIGKPIANNRVVVLGADGQLVPIGVPGELCVSGESLARGYLHRPELTAEKFVPNPFVSGERMYKTGDRVRWLPDGSIEFLGRLDDQVKVRGFRIELGEVTNRLLKHPAVREAVVIARRDEAGEAVLCAYFTAEGGWTTAGLRQHLAQELPDYMIPAHFIKLESLPLNANGKVDKRALPEPEVSEGTGSAYVAPTTELEAALAKIWQNVLQVERVGINDRFFELGGHSLKAMMLSSQIHKELDMEIPLREIFVHPTVREMAAYLAGMDKKAFGRIEPAPPQVYYPVTSAQKRLYVIQQMDGVGTSYHMPYFFRVQGTLDPGRLEEAIGKLVERHESLRTSFHLVEGELMQQVQAKVTVSIQYEQAADQEEAKRIMRAFIRPFDLERAPLFRVGVIDVGTGEAILMWDLHHIVADGISMSILFRDFARFYQGGALPELPLQYKDVAAWQQSEPVQTAKRVHETYWLRELAGELPVLELPTDFPRPPVQRYEGAYLTFTIDERLSGKLKQLAEKQEATPYMILLAAYTVLLSKYSGQEDIIVGTPVAGRSHADLQEIVGMFVNTLALRSHPKEEQTFLEFLAQMKDRVLAANEHQDYPLEELIEKLGGHRDMSRTPLFDTTFGMQNMEPPVLRLLPGLTLTPGELEWNRAKFDLSWILVEGSSLTGMVEYSTSLFTEATVQRMIAHYLRILEQIVEDPAKRLAEVELATEAEKTQILTVFNATEAPYPDQALAHQLFEEQVERSPEQLAVVYKDVALTYREVNARANQLARVLRAQGVTSDQIVGLMMKRSHECIIAMLAVMKAGGAYLPIDPEYPESRINYLLEDSQAKWLLVTRETEVPVSYRGIVIVVDEATYATEDRSNLVPVNEPEHLVYMIYTSGSTGKPKGVMIQHRSLCNLSLLGPLREIEPHSRVMQFASISFDSSVAEIFPALFMGATLYLEDRELLLSELTQYLKQNRITTAALPPSVLRSVPYEELPDLKTVISAGEACTLDLVQVWGQGRTFINEYGPTEGTVCATLARLTPDMAMVPIGKPIKNQQVYIVNRQHQLQPVGVVGELCIGGAGLARGYWNRPDLTAEKFVHNPFVPGERMYKTGDLARWLPDGSIEYLGRVDDQVKIRGHRIELGEVTARLLDHPVIKEAVVTARKDERGQSALCAYFTVAGPWSIAELRRHLAKELPDYMIPSHFIELDRIPLTPHGKVDKRALPEPVGAVETGVEYVAPTTEMERLLAESWRKVLGLERVGIHDHFLELGGDSIKAIQVVAHLKQHDYKVKINDLFQYPTIAGLATRVQTSEPQAEQGLVTGEVPLTPIQSWFFDKKFAEAHHWNQAMMLYRETGWEAHAVERVLHALITHHDALRMVYRQEGEQVKQFNRGLEGTCFAFEVFDLSAEPDVRGRIEREAGRLQRQHRLAEGPLLQVGLFRTATGDHLLFSIHHLVIDGVSWRILLEDFATAYEQVMRGKPIQLPPKTSSFQAWSRKLREYANSPELLKELDYWRRIEAKPIPAIPKDLPGEAPLTTAGCKTVTVTLSEMETRQLLTDVHAAYHTEMNDVLLTALALAVNRWGHSHALAVNMEGHGREEIIEELDLMRTVGWFTSTYPVVIELETEQISDAIKLVKEQLRKIPNKGIGYGILKYLTDLAHKQGCSFLAEPELSFNYLGQFDQEVSTGAFSQSAMPKGDELSPSSTTPHLLNIVGIVLNQRLELHFHYHTSVHRHETIANLAEQVKQWLQEIIRHCLGKEEAEMTPSDFSSNDLTFEEVEEISELLAELDLDE